MISKSRVGRNEAGRHAEKQGVSAMQARTTPRCRPKESLTSALPVNGLFARQARHSDVR